MIMWMKHLNIFWYKNKGFSAENFKNSFEMLKEKNNDLTHSLKLKYK